MEPGEAVIVAVKVTGWLIKDGDPVELKAVVVATPWPALTTWLSAAEALLL